MLWVDGLGYDHRGVAGAFTADAGLGLSACVLLALLLLAGSRKRLRFSRSPSRPVAR
jgi:hypothetical protein